MHLKISKKHKIFNNIVQGEKREYIQESLVTYCNLSQMNLQVYSPLQWTIISRETFDDVYLSHF